MEFLYPHSKSTFVKYCFFFLEFPQGSFSLPFLSLSFFSHLLFHKNNSPPQLQLPVKSALSWAHMSVARLQTVLRSHLHFNFCIIWVSKVKKDYCHINSAWWPMMRQKNFRFSVLQKYLSCSWGGLFCWVRSHLTLNPSWAALIAATYPPGPEPITVTSASTETEHLSYFCFSN